MLATRLRKKTRTPIGLDIGVHGLRAAQLVRVQGVWSAVATGSCERGVLSEESEVLRPAGQLVRMVTTRERFSGREVVAVMSSPDVDYFSLELPAAVARSEDGKLKRVVSAEVTRLMGSKGETAVTRYWRSPQGKPPSPNVVGIGASPQAVRQLLATVDDARLSCSVVEPAALALARLGSILSRPADDELWGVLDIGGRQARLVLCLGAVPVLGRSVGSGVREWTRRVAETLDVGKKSAEVHLCEHGVAAPGGREVGERRASRDSLAGLIMGGLRSSLLCATTEAQRSIAYLKQCYPDRSFRGLIAVGGGSLIPNVVSHLEHTLGIGVRRATEYLQEDGCGLSFSSRHGQPLESLGLAIGTALPT